MELLSNFGMREWLIGCGVILVLVVLFDGVRRMRSEQKKEIKMSLALGGGFPEDTEDRFGSELPNGGARVVSRQEPVIGGLESLGESDENQQFNDVLSDITEENERQNSHSPEEMPAQSPSADLPLVDDQVLLVLHVKSKAEKGFNGSDLLQVLLACDMRYGDRGILHRHEHAGGKGSLQFSVANMLEPGTFNLEDINSFRTPGVTFFVSLPGPQDAMQAFDCMLETANCLVKNLDAIMLDENHLTASVQVINHYRDQVKHFLQKERLSQEPA